MTKRCQGVRAQYHAGQYFSDERRLAEGSKQQASSLGRHEHHHEITEDFECHGVRIGGGSPFPAGPL
jgi:hypothetical protein